MILIPSADYIVSSLQAEFGKLPPAFLPVQNKRLFSHQLNSLPGNQEVWLSIPEDFKIQASDQRILDHYKVNILRVHTDLSLSESILYCLNLIGNYSDSLYILHGDTIISDFKSYSIDTFVLGKKSSNYVWANPPVGFTEDYTYAGFFSFSNIPVLIKCLLECYKKFIPAIERYRELIDVKLEVTEQWLDFGHSHTYFQSKSKLSTERAFNSLSIESFVVTKKSKQNEKIKAEYEWYKNLPIVLKKRTPQVFSFSDTDEFSSYDMEYLSLCSLSEIFVFGRLPFFVWQDIIYDCLDYMKVESQFKPERDISSSIKDMYLKKTEKRLGSFAAERNISLEKPWIYNGQELPGLSEIARETFSQMNHNYQDFATIVHGDFCFSNILFDFRTMQLKVIDPRGIDSNGVVTQYGDIRYDLAKLSHSILGLYDFIIAGKYSIERNEYSINFHIDSIEEIKEVQKFFLQLQFNDRPLISFDIYPIMIHLFLSMLPLHYEDETKQSALLANALRLYTEFKQLQS